MTPAAWQEGFIRLVFLAVAAVHLLPATGVLGRPVLERAYGIVLTSPDLLVLLQHRALLFALLGLASGVAAWQPAWRIPVGVAALVSMAGFVLVAGATPHGVAIQRVVWVDAALLPLLLVAMALVWRQA
jgi:hypothetical protein